MNKYDVAIAGAGVAGCHAARNLARMGRSVVLIDRRETSGLGHDWWDNVNMGIYDEVGLPAPEPPELLQGNINFKVFPPGQKTFSFVA
ncbi:MAG TPA: FAD-dependent oxidoreductase, partial [bacterium]|nr:FAD-dependent oxidoreductase [bacterium]